MTKKIVYTLVVLLNVIFLEQIQSISLYLGLSWTFSFSLPYFLLALFGILLALAVHDVLELGMPGHPDRAPWYRFVAAKISGLARR